MRAQKLTYLSRYLNARGDEHDQVVADPLQVGYQVRGHHYADLMGGGELHQDLQELPAG